MIVDEGLFLQVSDAKSELKDSGSELREIQRQKYAGFSVVFRRVSDGFA